MTTITARWPKSANSAGGCGRLASSGCARRTTARLKSASTALKASITRNGSVSVTGLEGPSNFRGRPRLGRTLRFVCCILGECVAGSFYSLFDNVRFFKVILFGRSVGRHWRRARETRCGVPVGTHGAIATQAGTCEPTGSAAPSPAHRLAPADALDSSGLLCWSRFLALSRASRSLICPHKPPHSSCAARPSARRTPCPPDTSVTVGMRC